jgi:D-alanyl-D-alanine carboxypeptidase
MTMRKTFVGRVLSVLLAIAIMAGFAVGVMHAATVAAVHSIGESSAAAMCTMDVATGRMFFAHNADQRRGMASTTKVVTALTVLENAGGIDTKIRIDDKAIGIEGSSIYLQRGEELTLRELLYGLMLRSGNDAAVALAITVGGSVENFAEMMNETAVKYGAVNSHFTNPHGLDDKEHYTTARDLCILSAAALRNPIFTEIVSTQTIRIDGVEMPRVLHNKNKLLKSLDGCIGVKTGFTKKCGRCFVGAREVNGQKTVCVVLNCGPMFEDTAELLREAQTVYPNRKILTAEEIFTASDGKKGLAAEDFVYPLSAGENVDIQINGERVTIMFNGKVVHEADCVPFLLEQ